MASLEQLQRKIGYHFKDVALLEQALTHRSAGVKHNERLEFLGDSIVNFIIAEALYRKFNDQKEGVLSRLRANIVKGDALAELGRAFSFGEHLVLGLGERKSAGHNRSSILAGAVEAVIGAIYLDAGFSVVEKTVLAWHSELLATLSLSDHVLDNKTKLQEYLQQQRQALPVYEVAEIRGKAHQQLFVVHCQVALCECPFIGEGTSRRKAEQAAAALALEKLLHGK